MENEEQPKRRFLRRARPASLTEPAEQTSGAEAPGAFEHYEPLAHDDVLEHHDPLEQPEPLAHDDLLEQDEPLDHEHATEQHEMTEPPHLQFDAPPARPRFTAEPPTSRGS